MADREGLIVELLRLVAQVWDDALRASEGAPPDFFYARFRDDLREVADRIANG